MYREPIKPRTGIDRITSIVIVMCVCGWISLSVAILVSDPGRSARRPRPVCESNLERVGELFREWRRDHPGERPRSGAALLLSFRVERRIPCGEEKNYLLCPGDQGAIFPSGENDSRYYDSIDLDHPPEDRCSYAVRDFEHFPLDPQATEPQILACDRQGADGRTPHHDGGLMVLFDDGSVEFMTNDDLGLAPEAPIVVGPDSSQPMLRQVVFIP